MIFLFFIIGILLWTLMEYVLHRFLGHEHKGKNLFKDEHLAHHSQVHYFAPAYKKFLSAIIVSVLLFGFMILFFHWQNAISFILGLMGMYGMYELCHSRFHKKDPLFQRFVVLRKHHFYHHFHNPKLNHGVTTRFWDKVFGTFHPVGEEMIKIPRKVAMIWLMNGEAIKPEYESHFLLS
jgi:4-hydroxysphinganine ceramide fatty acyl 2-hydroxylase